MATRFTVSVTNKTLLESFRRACKERGHSQAYVIGSAMRYFVEHPHQRGWITKGGVSDKSKKS